MKYLLVTLFVILLGISPTVAKDAVDSPEIMKHLEVNNDPIIGGVFMVLESGERQVDYDAIPAGESLEMAATCYALLTEDFQVSLRDLIDAGFWPYDIFSTGTDLDAVVSDPPGRIGLARNLDFESQYLNGIGSIEWTIYVKSQILWRFNVAYYLQPASNALDCPLTDCQRISSFWVNPVSGCPMVEGNALGDYSMLDVARYAHAYSGVDYGVLEVPKLNLWTIESVSSTEDQSV